MMKHRLGMQPKAGGKLHLRLNTDTSPIADKYREGKLKRTLKRERPSPDTFMSEINIYKPFEMNDMDCFPNRN